MGSSSNGCVGYYAQQIITDKSQSKLIQQDDYIFYNDNGSYYLIAYVGNSMEMTLPTAINGNSYTIYNYAFYGSARLMSVFIPNSVTSIGQKAFYGCRGLTGVYIIDIAAWCAIDFVGGTTSNPLYYAEKLYLNGQLVTDLEIPEGVTSIKKNVFRYCGNLTSITIPNSVTFIGEYAFQSLSCLTSVTFKKPNGWTVGETKLPTEVDLSNTATAVTYLKIYDFCAWTRADT